MNTLRFSIALVLFAAANLQAQDLDDLPVAKAVSTDDLPAAKPAKKSGKEATAKVTSSPTSRPLSVEIALQNQSLIRGTLTNTLDVQMKTAFGEINIPLSEVAGIKFAGQEDTTTSIIMLNGDSITGATDVKVLTVETEWGAAQVNGSGVSSLLLVPNLQWSSIAGLNGKRWYLTEANRPSSSATTSNSVRGIPPANYNSTNGTFRAR